MEKSLYMFLQVILIKIKNVEEKDDKIKDFLIDHVNKEEFIFSYEWSKGDLVSLGQS